MLFPSPLPRPNFHWGGGTPPHLPCSPSQSPIIDSTPLPLAHHFKQYWKLTHNGTSTAENESCRNVGVRMMHADVNEVICTCCIRTSRKQRVALTGRNHTGPPCSVGRRTAHAPGGGRPSTRSAAGSGNVTDEDDRRQQMPAAKQYCTVIMWITGMRDFNESMNQLSTCFAKIGCLSTCKSLSSRSFSSSSCGIRALS